jgi:GDPmannose 4,6-dehydratase
MTKPPVALITGVTGQDGAYLAEFLLKKGYRVHGIKRRSSSFNTGRVDHLYQDAHEGELRFILHYGDMTDATNLIRIGQDSDPAKARSKLGWHHRVTFEQLVAEMVAADLKTLANEKRHVLAAAD